jgi:hypothetical protein
MEKQHCLGLRLHELPHLDWLGTGPVLYGVQVGVFDVKSFEG